MTANASNSAPPPRPKTVYSLLTMVVVVACIVLPVMFWRGTWFGRRLTDEQLTSYLSSTDQPRKLQHALTEITERIDKNDGETKSYYPAIAALSDHDNWQVRNTAAWVMGWDHDGDGFQVALLSLLRDPVLVVRQNAALALVNFNDDAGKQVILAMLKSSPAISSDDGVARDLLQVDAPVRAGLIIGHIDRNGDDPADIESPISGRVGRRFVDNGDEVKKGEPVFEITPGVAQVTQALQGLAIIGDATDLGAIAELKNAAAKANPASSELLDQATVAERKIRERIKQD